MTEPLGIRALMAQSFRLLFSNFGTLFPLAFALALASAALPLSEFEVTFRSVLVGLLTVLVGQCLNGITMGVTSLLTLGALRGKRHTLGELTAQTLRHIVPMVVFGIALSIAWGVGMLLFIIPGFYVAARFLPWVQATVCEDAGWSGLSRAQELTEGYRWPLVGAALVVGIVIISAGGVIGIIAGIGTMILAIPLETFSVGGWPAVVFNAGISGLFYALLVIFTTLVYARLREIKEGVGIAQIVRSPPPRE